MLLGFVMIQCISPLSTKSSGFRSHNAPDDLPKDINTVIRPIRPLPCTLRDSLVHDTRGGTRIHDMSHDALRVLGMSLNSENLDVLQIKIRCWRRGWLDLWIEADESLVM